jgi:hypothetical protein
MGRGAIFLNLPEGAMQGWRKIDEAGYWIPV